MVMISSLLTAVVKVKGYMMKEKKNWMDDSAYGYAGKRRQGEHIVQIKVDEELYKRFQTIEVTGSESCSVRDVLESCMKMEVEGLKDKLMNEDGNEEEDRDYILHNAEQRKLKLLQTKVDKQLAEDFELVRNYYNKPKRQLVEDWMEYVIFEERCYEGSNDQC